MKKSLTFITAISAALMTFGVATANENLDGRIDAKEAAKDTHITKQSLKIQTNADRTQTFRTDQNFGSEERSNNSVIDNPSLDFDSHSG